MKDNDLNRDQFDQSAHIAAVMAETIKGLHAESDLPIEMILAGCHASVAAHMATVLGGDMAAMICKRAAERMEDLPSLADALLAAAPVAGRA